MNLTVVTVHGLPMEGRWRVARPTSGQLPGRKNSNHVLSPLLAGQREGSAKREMVVGAVHRPHATTVEAEDRPRDPAEQGQQVQLAGLCLMLEECWA